MCNKNFHNSIDNDFIDKIESISEFVAKKQLFLDGLSCVDLIDNEPKKDYVEYQHKSGYISYNRGGIELSLMLSAGLISGFSLTKYMTQWQDNIRLQCVNDFVFEYNHDNNTQLNVDSLFEQSGEIVYKFYDYESDYLLDCDLAMLQFRIVIDDDDNILLDLSVCYGDDYFRSSSFELIGALELSFTQFERIKLETIERFFKRALKRA